MPTSSVWRSGSSGSSGAKSFATTVTQMAEHEREVEDQRLRDHAAVERRYRLDRASLPIANRFRRRLEDILVEEHEDDYGRHDDNAFQDDNYVPSIDDMELGYDVDGTADDS